MVFFALLHFKTDIKASCHIDQSTRKAKLSKVNNSFSEIVEEIMIEIEMDAFFCLFCLLFWCTVVSVNHNFNESKLFSISTLHTPVDFSMKCTESCLNEIGKYSLIVATGMPRFLARLNGKKVLEKYVAME